MPNYKVITSQIVYEYANVEADNPAEARRLISSGEVDPQWNFLDYGEWRVEDVEEIKNA
jgi:hypothetical protein